MKQNLDVLKTEIQEYLEGRKLVVYYSFSRTLDTLPIVMWDTTRHPDYKMFVNAAEAAGVKMIVMHAREFSKVFIENATEQLDESDLSAEDRRTIERRLRDMRAYDGFTCAVEISFDLGQRAYIFELRTEWYDEFSDILEEIEGSVFDEDDDAEDEGPIGGYFSKN